MQGVNNADQKATGTDMNDQQELEQLEHYYRLVVDATGGFDELTFDQVLIRAAHALQQLVPEARLQVSTEHSRPTGTGSSREDQRGLVRLEDGTCVYSDVYLGPPEPVWFSASGFSDDPAVTVILDLFFDRLQRALHLSGYSEELGRQSHRDWLTGLHWAESLEAALQELDPFAPPLAVLLIDLPVLDSSHGKRMQQLRKRWFAHSLRLTLAEEDRAFQLEGNITAVLTPEAQLDRLQAAVSRLAPEARLAYALTGEASGSDVVNLALTRLTGRDPRRDQTGRARSAEPVRRSIRPVLHPLTRLSGTSTGRALLEHVTRDWQFSRPISLILDLPTGFALERLATVRRPVLAVTDGASSGYLYDLMEHEPEGLVVGTLAVQELRTHLETIARGERVYAGPVIEGSGLFPREREVWRLIARGLSNAQVATVMGISERTAANYFTGLRDKLHLNSRSEVALAYWDQLGPNQ